MASLEEIIKKQKEHLTNAQIKALSQAVERYKQLNNAQRAEAYSGLHRGLVSTRRGLQNVGLAARRGKLISGAEKAADINAQDVYGGYNAGLDRVANAYTEQAAARMARETAIQEHVENLKQQQEKIKAEAERVRKEYERARAAQAAAERARQAAAMERERANQEQFTDPRLNLPKPTLNQYKKPVRAAQPSSDVDPRFASPIAAPDKAIVADYRHYMDNVERFAREQQRYEQAKQFVAEYKPMSPRDYIGRRKYAEAKDIINNYDAYVNGDRLARFAVEYKVDLDKVRADDPDLAKTISNNADYWYKLIDANEQNWNRAISENTHDAKAAYERRANAYSNLARLAAAAKAPNEQRKLYMMTDDEFNVAFDAAEHAYKMAAQNAKIARDDSSDNMDDVTSDAYAKESEAMQRFAIFERVKRDRANNSDISYLAYSMTIPDSAKVKDEEYDSTVSFVSQNQQNWRAVPWAQKSEWNGRNWKEAYNRKWDATDYAKEHDTKGSKYAALVNEWSFINGRTALLYSQKFQGAQFFGNIKELIGSVFGGDVNRDAAYKWFRNSCVMAFRGDWETSGTASQKEQMDAMLTLANLMTDEERARFNALLDNIGASAADKYFKMLYTDVLPERFASYVQGEEAFDTRDAYGKVMQSIASVPVNLAQGIPGVVHTLKTNQDDPVAARLAATKYTTAQNMRNAVSKDFGGFGQFAYGTGMSMADSATVAMIGSGIGGMLEGVAGMSAEVAGKAGSTIGGALLGASAFNSSYKEAIERGLSPDEARATALGNGINEMLFEAVSLDMLVGHFQKGGILKVSKNGFVNWLVNTMVQGGVEGSEEVFTDIGNNVWDKLVNGVYAEEVTKLREYISQGMSYDEAKRKVNAEFAEQLGMSFLGGFVSGGVMGGGSTFLGMLQGQDVAKIGRNLDDAAKAEIREYDFKNEEAKEILTGKLTDEDYGRLAMTRLEEMAQTDPIAADKAAQALIDATARTDVKVDKRHQTLKTGTENSVSFDYDGVTDVKKMSGVQVEALRFAQTLVKSKVGGVNINVANNLYDQNGNEQNGWYDAKTNTVHVSLNGSQSVVYTISHELTHRLKSGNKEAFASMRDAMKSELESLDLTGSDLPEEYENILGDYLVKDGEQRTAWEALIEYEMDRYAKHGITLDRESAEEEVVCRACETMLERSRLISSMISRNVRSAKTVAKFLANIYDDIASLKEEAESRGYVDGSPEKLFVDQYTDVEKIANAWANAMKTVSQDTTKKIVKEEGRGGTAFSLKQELRDDGQSLADMSMKYRKAHKAESQHISDEMLEAANKQIHRMAQRMLPFLTLKNKKGMTYLPDEVLGKTRFGNSSYGGTSIENTTICFRTLAYIDFTNEIKKQIGRPLTVSESFLASQMLYQIAKEPQCLYCYVSLDRKAYDEQLLSYIKQRDKVVEGFNKLSLDERQAITKATRNPIKAFEGNVPLYTEFLAGRKNTEQMRTRFAQWIDIANSGSEAITAADLATDERRGLMRNGDDWQQTKRTAGKVSLQDQVIDAERYAQSASWAKKMEEYRAYNGDILKIGKRTVNKLNNEYGLRFYSFSEYSPAFIVENMQQIRDAALKGLMGLAYTKKTDFARIFAVTGMNINVSTFGRWGVDADGNRVVVMDSDQGADWTEVQNLRKQYENVGAVFVATDDAMTEWAIKQDWIDVVIPFHIVRTGANVAEFYKWVVHNSEQNDVTAEGKNATIPAAEHGNSYEKYMSLVNERGLTPRFDKWRPENNPNVTADEYMKLVNETRRTLDATKPLQPIYDTREAAISFAAFVHDGGYYGDYYKAKSEQDIKVPVTPEQDILGIGSKTYTEQEGIDRVVADIKAGNKANQVPYGRQDIDEQISRLNKARQVKQHGQKLSIKESSKLSVTPMSNDVSSEMNTKFSIREESAPTKTQDVYKLMRLGKDGRLYPLFIDSAEGIDVGVWYNADSPDMSDLKTLPSGVYLIGNDGKDIVTLADYQRTHGEKASKFPSKSAINSAATDGKRWVFIEDVAKGQRRYGGENRKYWNLGINGSGSVSTFAMRPGWHAGSLPTMRQIGKGANRNLRDDTFVWVKGRVSADVDYQAEASQNPDNDIPTHIPTNGFYMKATNPNATAAQTDTVGWYIAGAFIADKIMSDSEARNVIDDWNAKHPSDYVEYDWERESGGEFDAETMSIRNAKFSLKESDAQYMDLARRYESGDKSVEAELRKQVDAAASAAGAASLSNGKVKKYYHGTGEDFTSFNIDKSARGIHGYGFYVSAIKDVADHYAPSKNGKVLPLYLMTDNLATRDDHRITAEMIGDIVQKYDIPGDLFQVMTPSQMVENESDAAIIKRLEAYLDDETTAKPSDYLKTFREVFGYDGLRMPGENVVWSNDLLKSADLVTYDSDGNLIPLSERFKTDRTGEDAWKNEDIRYSLKDDVRLSTDRATLAGQMHEGAKGARALRAQAEKYNERIDELNGRIGKLNKRIAELKTQIEDVSLAERMHQGAEDAAALRKVRDEYNERIAQRDRLLEAVRKQRDAAKQHAVEVREQERAARVRRDIVAVLKRGNDRIVKMLANPTENAHVPVQLAQAVSEYAQRLNELLTTRVPMSGENAGIEKQTKKGALNAQKIIDALNRSYADKETIDALKAEDPSFNPRGLLVQYDEKGNIVKDETLVKMIKDMDSIIQGKHLSDLTEDELRFVLNTMRGVIHTVTEANKVTVQGEQRNVYRTSRQMANEVNSAAKVFGDKSNKITKFLNRYVIESLGLRRIAKLYSGSNENAVFVKMVDDLNEGALEQERIKQTLRGMFNEVTTKYAKEMDTWYGKNAEWIDTGFGFKITKGMRVSLAMHILNEQNLRNVEQAGLLIPDMKAYSKGNIKEAYTNGKVFRLTKAQAQKIVDNMTEAEKAYFEVAKEFFHKRSGYYINRTSLKLLGYSKAVVKNYFPIQTVDAYRTVKYDDVRQTASVEHPGFLETRKGTANEMYLNDITAVVNRQIDGVAKYAGLAIPMRNWNNIMNAWLFEENADGEWVRSKAGNVHKVLERRMGYTNGKQDKSIAIIDYVDQFITDLTSPGVRDANEKVHAAELAAKLTSNYVKAVLTLNARVALSQLASVPTAAAEIPWKYIVQSFGGNVEGHLNRNASNDLIDQYTPIFAMRRAGTQTEVSEVMKRKGLSEKAEQKLPWALGWITAMDTAATRRLWYACERWVKGETKIPVGSDAFYKEVAKRYERVIQNTQPNFTVLQRSPALRSKNAAARIITMFGTQRMQNAGVFIESLAEVVQAKDKATRKTALKRFGRTLSGLITAAIVIGLERAIVSALRGRMRPLQDEDKEITAKSVDKYIRGEVATSLAGSFMYVGELYDFVHGIVSGITEGDSGYEQSFALPAAEALSTMIGFFRDKDWQYFKYMQGDHTDHEKWLKTKSFVNELMTVASYATGLPLQNASKTILNGWLPLGQDIADAVKTGELNPWLHQSGKLDKKQTAANYKDWTNAGFKGSEYFYWEKKLSEYGKRDEKIPILLESDLPNEKKAMLLRMMDKSGATSEGTVVYKSNGDVLIDFANPTEKQQALPMPTAETEETATPTTTPTATPKPTENPLTDARQEGVKEAVAKGVPEQTAFDAFLAYQNMGKNKSDDYSRNDDFRAWLFANVDSPEQRAVLEYQVIGTAKKVEGSVTYRDSGVVFRDYTNESWFKLSEHNLSKDGTNKRYEAGKRLEKTGLSVDKTVAIYDALADYTKKAEWTEYLKKQGLTDEQVNIFLWSRGWAKLK